MSWAPKVLASINMRFGVRGENFSGEVGPNSETSGVPEAAKR